MKNRREILRGALTLVGMGAVAPIVAAEPAAMAPVVMGLDPAFGRCGTVTVWFRVLEGGRVVYAQSEKNPEQLSPPELVEAIRRADELQKLDMPEFGWLEVAVKP
jgi:hypothetical protein